MSASMKTCIISLFWAIVLINPFVLSAQSDLNPGPMSSRSDSVNPIGSDTKIIIDYRSGSGSSPLMHAVRLGEDYQIKLDGRLDEPVWQKVPVATDFTQRFPNDMARATQRTEVRLVYTDDAIYVGFIAYDTAPDSILAPLFRRDGSQPSDWVYVSFDSYNDRRTAFSFAVNPRGVQKDVLYFDDNKEDVLWDAVWEAKTYIGPDGWSAEMRIPFSQLRFSSRSEALSWGVNFQRRLARNGEIAFWSPTPRTQESLVSQFGRLQGINNLAEPRRLEIAPYSAGSLLRAPNPGNGNPYYNSNQFSTNVGGDIKYGLTSDFTLTATINPDFGQVEADPAVINLTANENFFNERRPFFLEGSDLFLFGSTQTFSRMGNPITFYSRRIGRSPQGSAGRAGVSASHIDRPDYTTIASAAKVSGKTQSGWSLGIINAYTLDEHANYIDSNQNEGRFRVEPATNYFVARTKKDFNNGNSYVGGFGSSVHRSISGSYFENYLRSSAYIGGVDYEHNFGNRSWVTSGTASFTSVHGSTEAIEMTQRSPARYFHRVDSDGLSVDANRSSLFGYATELSLQKRGGNDHWLGSITYSEVSPGYETNDIGFQNRADYRGLNGGIVFRDNTPKRLQYYETWLFTGNSWNFDGDRFSNWYNLGTFIRFKNLWSINGEVQYRSSVMSDRLTRGGPVARMPESYIMNANIQSNPNKKLSWNTGTFIREDSEGGGFYEFWAGFRVQPATWLQLSVNPNYFNDRNKFQYLSIVTDNTATHTYGRRYVFAELDQHTVSVSLRLDWTFSPTMSLQTFVRPYLTSGSYSNIKELNRPRSYNYTVYGTDQGTITTSGSRYVVDPTGTGDGTFQLERPDFDYRSIQGNAVFRWEYRPGSTLFLVWQQQRSDFDSLGEFDMGNSLGSLFRSTPTNIFMVKLSYWLGR